MLAAADCRSASLTLPVVETFHSLQGEGLHAGLSAFFIRLGGCQVGCSWCDTKQSWPLERQPQQTVAELVDSTRLAAAAGAAFTVITGGEPLHHDLTLLCAALRDTTALPLHLETSGVDRLSGSFDWITLSPKPHRPPTAELLNSCHELKVVVHSAADIDFAEAMAAAAAAGRQAAPVLLLQPGWGSSEGQRISIAHVRSNPRWRLSLQTHKWLAIR